MVDIENMDISERIRKEGMRRRYSPRTIQAYQDHVRRFLEDIQKPLKEITKNLGGEIEIGELTIEESKSGRLLPAGIFARWFK